MLPAKYIYDKSVNGAVNNAVELGSNRNTFRRARSLPMNDGVKTGPGFTSLAWCGRSRIRAGRPVGLEHRKQS